MKQEDKIIRHLKLIGHITPIEALEEHGVYRLSAVIYRLRNKGYNIITMNMESTNQNGERKKYAKYVLKKDLIS